MKLLSTALTLGLTLVSAANADPHSHSLGMLGNLVRTNIQGDYRYAGASAFVHSGVRGYIDHFTNLLATNPADRASYRDVMMQGITSWEDENRPKGFTNDLAASMAFYTVTNVALAKNRNYKDYLFPNLVSQYRKALASASVAALPNAKKQDIYDYMLAESVYLQTLASSGRDKDATVVARILAETSAYHLRETFGVDPGVLTITEAGLKFQ